VLSPERLQSVVAPAGVGTSPSWIGEGKSVAKDEAIVRFMLMASHAENHIDRTLEACSKAMLGLNAKG